MTLHGSDPSSPSSARLLLFSCLGLALASSACSGDDSPSDDEAAGDTSTEDTDTDSDTDTGSDTGSGSDSTTGGQGDPLDAEAIARIEDAVELTLGTGYATGCSVAIWRDGAVIYAEGFGTKNEADELVTPDTLFQIGSDTKKMTAIALLREVDAGALELDSTLAEFLPGLELEASPGVFDTLTVDRLLSHRSGLFDYTPFDDAPDDAELQARTYAEFAANEYAMVPPGVAWSYSNPNYTLAGVLTEALAERPWADVVIDDVAAPLDMDHTYARRDDMLASEVDIASGFGPILSSELDTFSLLAQLAIEEGPADWTSPEDHADNAFTRPAGLVWSTATDMAKLGGFLIEGDEAVLSDELREQMQVGQAALGPGIDPETLGYGYGVMAARGFNGPQGYRDVRVVQHGGNTLDMTSTFVMLPDQGVVVSVLSNGSGDDMSLVAAVALEEAAEANLPEPSEPTTPYDPPAEDLSVYAGAFGSVELGEASIAWSGSELEIEVPLLAQLEVELAPAMTPVARDVFVLSSEAGEFEVAFYPGLDATPNRYLVNRSFAFTRDAEEGNGILPLQLLAPMKPARSRPLSPPRWARTRAL
ncbi:hypothetical protein PPSIR1_16660 [Plesiocystis pacifica SIR-1]|uniref:Beta-lactamase-related domain-containing protein n=1 Tax=Plesiocystis pacifica SIR-1 TaxID=391625 RepID=A6G387_9BACT|nr:serine hydrolase domain-containing protein [Plesiocystis pacifica]EDM79712.1 hypothetical protein PPSIR1_16660 [Plesiocystis pacifica SIR-1]